MKVLVVLSAVLAVALAKPGFAYSSVTPYYGYPALSYGSFGYYGYGSTPVIAKTVAAYPYAAAPVVTKTIAAPVVAPVAPVAPIVAPVVPATVKSQYHAQDELGQASYGHQEPGQVHHAVQDAAGNKVGSFSYLNPTDGKIHRTDYVADALGYRVASNDLPLGPSAPIADTPEVAAAKAAHFAAVAEAKHRVAKRSVVHTPASTSPLAFAAPVAIAAPAVRYAAPISYAAPIAYSAPVAHAPLAYTAPVAHAPLAYAAPVAHTYTAGYPATLTTVVNTPGHAVSYRVD